MRNNLAKTAICKLGKTVISTELAAVDKLLQNIDSDFAAACQQLLNCQGHVIVIGMGKSGHIANKIAATLASTGTPAFFVHPGEASHGDLGMITERDIIIAISNSGNTAEILEILPLIKRLNISLISITNKSDSALAKAADINLDIKVEKEACPLGLAPTASTTTTLVLGDALAITLLEMRGFSKQDFALSHPGGNLGKKLLLKVDGLMQTGGKIPQVALGCYMPKALLEMTAKTLGMTTVVDNEGKLAGIFTDGDLRRILDSEINIHSTQIDSVMTKNCKTINPEMLAFDALQLMEEFKITVLAVVNKENSVVGIIHIHNILQSGLS